MSEYSHGKTVFFFSFSHPLSLKHYLSVVDSFRTYLCHSGHFCKLSTHSFLTCQSEANAIHIRHALPSFVSCFCKPHQPVLFEQWFYRPRVYDITITRSNLRGITNRIFFCYIEQQRKTSNYIECIKPQPSYSHL